MRSVADMIEAYILGLMEATGEKAIKLKRSILAKLFGCAPSQVTYVIKTRFTLERGFIVETQAGRGGFVVIRRIPVTASALRGILSGVENVDSDCAFKMIEAMERNDLIGRETAKVLRLVVGAVASELPKNLTGRVLKKAFSALLGAIERGE